LAEPITNWKNNLVNDFENSLFPQEPILANIKNKLYEKGALYASMSGSGSTLFGIFKDNPNLSEEFKNCFYFASELT
jgi:4-diphosphocytidyl-2-C-methyl-D-erythritol kinase